MLIYKIKYLFINILLKQKTYLDKTIIEGQIVSQRILPSSCVFAVVGKSVGNKLVNFRKG